MVTKLHVISGLPRSGSTLLCAILRQNPRFKAAMTSPVASLISALIPSLSNGSEFSAFFDNDRRRAILRGVFEAYYGSVALGRVVFDTNRSWTGRIALLRTLFPECRIICCVREIGWIIDSIERMLRQNPLQHSRMFHFKPGTSVYGRAEMLMNSDNGVIGLAWSLLREAWFSENANSLVIVPYEKLVREPKVVIKRLYEEIGEPAIEHDFEHVAYDEPDYDTAMGMPGLHRVRPRVEYQTREPCVPPDIFARYADTHFWLKPELTKRRVTVL